MTDPGSSDNPTESEDASLKEAGAAVTESEQAAAAADQTLKDAEAALEGADEDGRDAAASAVEAARNKAVETGRGLAVAQTRVEERQGFAKARKTTVVPDWREGLPKEHRTVAKKFTGPADVVKSYAELQKKLGSAINLPAEDASEEEIATFHKQLGRPDKPEDYVLEPPDLSALGEEFSYNEELDAQARTWFFNAGVSQIVAQELFDGYNSWALGMAEAMANRDADAMEKAKTELKKEWGPDYDANMDFANRGLQTFFGKDARNITLADGTAIGSYPVFARGLAEIGRLAGEARLLTGEADDESRQTLEERLKELQARGDYWTDPKIQTEVRAINDQLYGTAPADRPAEVA